jgi:hypothetical protein
VTINQSETTASDLADRRKLFEALLRDAISRRTGDGGRDGALRKIAAKIAGRDRTDELLSDTLLYLTEKFNAGEFEPRSIGELVSFVGVAKIPPTGKTKMQLLMQDTWRATNRPAADPAILKENADERRLYKVAPERYRALAIEQGVEHGPPDRLPPPPVFDPQGVETYSQHQFPVYETYRFPIQSAGYDLDAAIHTLTLREQAVVRADDEAPAEEIAEALGMTVSAYYSIRHRAMTKLRALFAEEIAAAGKRHEAAAETARAERIWYSLVRWRTIRNPRPVSLELWQAFAEGAQADPDDDCPYDNDLLIAAWRKGRQEARERPTTPMLLLSYFPAELAAA